ncbi:MAG TPA: DUF370 domain-containing protein [Candidatus Scatomorpha gallistercoris]|nr:DUF370 domain-containing protein [Candidatus Scatomorpha gallistercoris]
MYLSIGGGFVVRRRDIVAVFDMDNATYSRISRDALSLAEKRGEVINAAEDIPRTFIVCEEGGKRRVYLSGLSGSALKRRMG